VTPIRRLIQAAARAYTLAALSQRFSPGWWGILVNPFFVSRRLLHREVARCAPEMRGGVLLDIGCGTKPYRPLFDVAQYWGIEMPGGHGANVSQHDALYDGKLLPFRDAAVDRVVMSEVLEHVFEPDVLLDEVRRILRRGGLVLVTVPFAWDEHEAPNDYGRYTSFGLAALLRRHSLEPVRSVKNGNYLSALGQLLSAYLYGATAVWPLPVRALVYASLCAGVLLSGMVAGRIAHASPGFYLDNVVLARRV
jgi:SAM-dependent methyltransferase